LKVLENLFKWFTNAEMKLPPLSENKKQELERLHRYLLLIFGVQYAHCEIFLGCFMSGKIQMTRRPLLLATSGGSGCVSAIEAVATTLRAQGVDLPTHKPALRKDKTADGLAKAINMASNVMNAPGVKSLATAVNIPVIPNMESLEEEMAAIEAGQKKERIYIDFLLDVIESGYVLASLVNLNAKRADTNQSRNMVAQQINFERLQFEKVKAYFLEKLREAKKNDTPYTEIITTQMISMDAICAAVIEYNKSVPEDESVQVHQYLSDVFTSKAQHYVKSLNRLDQSARSILHLHGMNIAKTADELLKTNIKGKFSSIEEIDYLNNPMVRQGFKEEGLAQYKIGASETQNIPVQDEQGNDTTRRAIQPEEKVAAIMLSSVGGESTVNYASLLSQLYTDSKPDYDKIFVFCGRNKKLKEQLEQEKNRAKGREKFLGIEKPCEIIILGNQDAEHVANIFTRSDLTVMRGGVVLMEQMALGLNHHPEQRYFFPHVKDNKNNLTTGLSWEDGSIDYFIDHLREKHGITEARKGEVDDFCSMLKPGKWVLNTLNSYKQRQQFQGTSQELNDAIFSLLEELINDLEAQYKANASEQKISHSVAYELAINTMKYIDELTYLMHIDDSPDNQKKEKLRKLIIDYDVICYPIANDSKFSQSVINVIAASVTAFAVGFIIGVAAGIWTGPGAIATGLLVATLAGGTAAATGAIIMSNSFFKPKPVEQKRQALVECAKQDESISREHSNPIK
jgi:hypothetical protein